MASALALAVDAVSLTERRAHGWRQKGKEHPICARLRTDFSQKTKTSSLLISPKPDRLTLFTVPATESGEAVALAVDAFAAAVTSLRT